MFHKRPLTFFLLFIFTAGIATVASRPKPLSNAHSHNNYMQKKPFWGAIELGYTSIEADIHLKNGKLLVGHDDKDLREDRTLQTMYLDPLRRLARQNGGRILPGGPTQILLIDLKTEADSTYGHLSKVLADYADMLVVFDGEKKKDGAVLVIVSGNRNYAWMKSERPRYAAMDGRLADLSGNDSVDLIPMISDTWEKAFTWRGLGPIPPEESLKLHNIVEQAHRKGQWVRFWATPDQRTPARERVWKVLLDAGVDFLNSDDLPALRKFLLKNAPVERGKTIR